MNMLGIDLIIKGSDEVEKQVASELELPDSQKSMAKIVGANTALTEQIDQKALIGQEFEDDKKTSKTNTKPT